MVLSGADVPGEQVADAIDGVAGDAGEHVAEVGFGIEAVELGGLDQGIEGSGTLSAGIRTGEEPIFPAEGNRPVILPMSDRNSSSSTAGTRFMGVASGGNTASNGSPVGSFTSRRRPAWSRLWRRGCWIPSPAPGWRWVHRV